MVEFCNNLLSLSHPLPSGISLWYAIAYSLTIDMDIERNKTCIIARIALKFNILRPL